MPNSTIEYRIRIRTASTVAAPNGIANAFVYSSSASDPLYPFITSAPSGDGQEVDPVTGQTRTGSYVVEVADPIVDQTAPLGPQRAVTQALEDSRYLMQLLGRRAYVEQRTNGGAWTGLIAGYVLSVRLVAPVRYAITVGDTRRVEQTQPIFTGNTLGSFTTRGTFIGGPLTADWGPSKARGGWKFRLDQINATDWTATFLEGYAPTVGAPLTRNLEQIRNLAQFNRIITSYARPTASFLASPSRWEFGALNDAGTAITDGVVAYIGSTSTNAVATSALLVDSAETHLDNPLEFGRMLFYWPTCPYASGSTVYISLTTADVRTECPLYVDAHPVDIVTAIWTAARILYDPAGAWIATIRAAIGENVRLALRLTEAPTIAEFIENAICGPFGVAVRTNGDGNQELVSMRIGTTAVPSLTIAAGDLISSDPVVFDLDERTAINSVTLTQQAFGVTPTTFTPPQDQPADGIVANELTQTARYQDAALTTFAGRDITFRVPGMIHTASDFTPSQTQTLDVIGRNILPRFGRGSPVAEVQVLASAASAAAQVGDEVFMAAPHYPNQGYRIGESTVGARIMQLVRRTETPVGPLFRLIDSGIDAQPVSPAATITIAASTLNPQAIAQYTITNAATINAGNVLGIEVEWGVGATPTSNGIFARYLPGQVPTGAVRLTAVIGSGTQVQVRARTTQTGRRPSAWTAWQSVTLTAIPTPGAITVGATTATSVAISWTNTAANYPVFVYAYLGGSAPATWDPYLVTTLPPGSTSTVVRTLEAGTYQLAIAYSTATGPGPLRTGSVTTSGAGTTATRPAGLALVPLLDDATLPQGIALGLYASDQTLDLVIERSLTTGSGFAQIARVPGSTEIYVDRLARNGTTYYYRAKAALGGFVTSAATGEVSALARGVPGEVLRPAPVAPIVQVVVSETATTATLTLVITDPQARLTQVRFRHRTNAGAWSGWTVDTSLPYEYTQSMPATGFLDIEYEVSAFAVDGIERIVSGGVESFDKGTTANFVSVVGTFDAAGVFTLAASADTDTQSMRFATSTTAQPNLATTQAAAIVNARVYTTTVGTGYVSGTTVYVSALAYTGVSGTGTESALYEYRFVRDGAIVYTECRITPQTSTATTITVVVTATATTGTPTVQLQAITGSATLNTGAAIGVAVASGSTWVFNRGAALGQPGGAIFRAVLAGAQSDDDLIEIPEQGRDTTYLTTRVRAVSTNATQVVVRVVVLDKYTALPASVSYISTGITTITPASPQSVTCAVGDTFPAEVVGEYVDFTITRPAIGLGTGRVVFTATATGRVADSNPIDIPAQERVGPSLSAVTTPGSSSYSIAVTFDGTPGYDLDGAAQGVGGWTSPQTVTVTRNDYTGAPKVAAFRATKDGITIGESVTIPARDQTTATITIGTQSADSTTNVYTFTWSTAGFPTGTVYDLQYRTVTTSGGNVEEGLLTSQTSPVNVTSGYTIGSSPTYTMTVFARSGDTVIMQRVRSGTFLT